MLPFIKFGIILKSNCLLYSKDSPLQGIKSMKISKLKALWSLMTGGWTGLATYLLEAINKTLKKLDPAKIKQVAVIVEAVASALKALVPLMPDKYQAAVSLTIETVSKLAEALKSGDIDEKELDGEINAIEAAIQAWKDAKRK